MSLASGCDHQEPATGSPAMIDVADGNTLSWTNKTPSRSRTLSSFRVSELRDTGQVAGSRGRA